jgi:hypothetical protein
VNLSDLDIVRSGWQRELAKRRLSDAQDEHFSLGGLSTMIERPSVRFLILPGDPSITSISFDQETRGWWQEVRAAPVPDQHVRWGDQFRSIAHTLLGVPHGEHPWRGYYALHRNGALEFDLGTSGVRDFGDGWKLFLLIPTVVRIWCAVFDYNELIQRFSVAGPWQLTLAIRDTQPSVLGGLGADWHQPERLPFGRKSECIEPAICVSREIHEWPKSHQALHDVAVWFGDFMEDAFGSPVRRYAVDSDGTSAAIDSRGFAWNASLY